MNYQALARKWRPKSFATLVGQEHVVRALTHALDENRLHHAYLLTGTRGVGKTTIARILAKALNCEAGVTSQPCGTCANCQEIDGGRFVDYVELDAASNTGIDDMTALLEKAVYAPARGRFKVYVIDEVHQLSKSAFNAMLKTLEEPPEHVKFILATTDPQKIPVTVLSRCLQFNLKQMPVAHIQKHLAHILDEEHVPYESPALQLLGKAASGSMRDALSLLDQAIAYGAGKLEEAAVRGMLGTVTNDYLYALLDALLARDASALLTVAEQMNERALSFADALQELASLLHRIALLQLAPDAIAAADERASLQKYADGLDKEFLQLCYQIVIHGRDDLALAPDEYTGFAMTLLRLLAFFPERVSNPNPVPAPGTSSASNANKPARSVALQATASAPVVKRAEVAAVSAMAAAASAASAATPPASNLPAVQITPTPQISPTPLSVAQPHPPTVPASPPAALATPVAPAAAPAPNWPALVESLKLRGMALQLAQHCELRAQTATSITLALSGSHPFLLNSAGAQDKLREALNQHFGQPMTLSISLDNTVADTPAAQRQQRQDARHAAAVAVIEADPFIQQMITVFGVKLDHSKTEPLN